jgi:hypothetical protein
VNDDSPDRIRDALRRWKADMGQLRKDLFTSLAAFRTKARQITREADTALDREFANIARELPDVDYRDGEHDLIVHNDVEEIIKIVRENFAAPDISDALEATDLLEQEIREAD